MRILRNQGEIEIDVIKTMGVNVKESGSAIGYFGTGLKYAIAVFLREEIGFRLFIGQHEYEFYTETKSIRGKDFDLCMMRGPFDSCELGFTTELGKNWEAWQAYREIHSNCLDESGKMYKGESVSGVEGYTTFAIDEIDGMDDVFLDSNIKNLLFSGPKVKIYEGESSHIYYRGIRAKDLDKPSIYTYDIIRSCTLTEDRLIRYDFSIEEAINDSLAEMEDRGIIKEVITAPKRYFESGLRMGFNNTVAPSETFISVFQENSKNCNYSAREFVVEHAPKEKLTPEQLAAKFREELDDFCNSHGIEYDVDGDGFVTLMAQDILKL